MNSFASHTQHHAPSPAPSPAPAGPPQIQPFMYCNMDTQTRQLSCGTGGHGLGGCVFLDKAGGINCQLGTGATPSLTASVAPNVCAFGFAVSSPSGPQTVDLQIRGRKHSDVLHAPISFNNFESVPIIGHLNDGREVRGSTPLTGCSQLAHSHFQ